MAKIRIKTPTMEIEIEGADHDEMKKSLKEVLEMVEQNPPAGASVRFDAHLPSAHNHEAGRVLQEGTINTAISRLGGDTCKAVLEAAAAHLVFFQGRDRFTDEEWESTAKTANAWKAKWRNEKAKTKKRLIDAGFVIENAAGVYSLSTSARDDLDARLS